MTEHNFEHMRRAMVASQLRTTGVNDPRVVAAMGAVPRERFVPENYRLGRLHRLPRAAGPWPRAQLADGAGPDAEREPAAGSRACARDRSGHRLSAAVAARLARSVVALEEQPELAARARGPRGRTVEVVEGPLNQGWAQARLTTSS
jgi:protein-L-isoaspartate(D-aspartate) O-methyltransferase